MKIGHLFKKSKEKILEEMERTRLMVAVHPKVVIWRLNIFGLSPFLSRHILKIAAVIFVFFLFFGSFYFFSWRAPAGFPEHALVTVERGESLSQIATSFQQSGTVRSGFWLKVFITLLGGEKNVIAGDYYFPEPQGIFGVVGMLHKGRFGLIPIRITIHEGLSSYEIADLLKGSLPAFNAEDFINEVDKGDFEGYLFPDTYFFMPNTKAGDVILTMRESFARQIKEYEEDILKSKKPLKEIVIMASIIEGEGRALESKRIISGILWRRISKGLPLQVDAPFKYYNGKNSYTLTKDELKEEHPYNTYINKGLPPTAINNPGIDSIRAAIAPTNTDFLFFLSDKGGNMHYAKDFEGHQANREAYLN